MHAVMDAARRLLLPSAAVSAVLAVIGNAASDATVLSQAAIERTGIVIMSSLW